MEEKRRWPSPCSWSCTICLTKTIIRERGKPVCVIRPHPPWSVSARYSRDSGSIILLYLIIHTRYEGKDPAFDAHSSKKDFKWKKDSKSNGAVSIIQRLSGYCCRGDRMHMQHSIPALPSTPLVLFCPKKEPCGHWPFGQRRQTVTNHRGFRRGFGYI